MGAANNFHNRNGGSWHTAVKATQADSGSDPALDTYGKPIGFMLSADGNIKFTDQRGNTQTLALFGKVEYRGSLKLVWDTGTDAIDVYLLF